MFTVAHGDGRAGACVARAGAAAEAMAHVADAASAAAPALCRIRPTGLLYLHRTGSSGARRRFRAMGRGQPNPMSTRGSTSTEQERRFRRGDRQEGDPTDGRAPDKPTQIGKRGWLETAKRTVKEFKEDNLTDWAAALTYYAVLSLFPAIIALVSIVGLAGKSATDTLINNVKTVTSGRARNVLTNAFTGLSTNRGTAGVLFV